MENEYDKNEKFEPRDNKRFLDKIRVQIPVRIKIYRVTKNIENPNRPLFYAHFPDGDYAFDLNFEEMEKVVSKWGNVPSMWVEKEAKIKANPYYNKRRNKEGFTLQIWLE